MLRQSTDRTSIMSFAVKSRSYFFISNKRLSGQGEKNLHKSLKSINYRTREASSVERNSIVTSAKERRWKKNPRYEKKNTIIIRTKKRREKFHNDFSNIQRGENFFINYFRFANERTKKRNVTVASFK